MDNEVRLTDKVALVCDRAGASNPKAARRLVSRP